MLQISLISIQFWGTVSRFRNWSVTEPWQCWTCPVCLPKYQLFKLLHPFFEVRGRARIEGQINYRELMLFTKSSTFGQHPNRVIYSFLTLIDSFFFLYKHKRWKSCSLFHPWPLNLHIPPLSRHPFTFLSSQKWIQWVDMMSWPICHQLQWLQYFK